VAAQAIDWRVGMRRDPNPHTADTWAVAAPGGTARVPGGVVSVSAEEADAFAAATRPERRATIAQHLGIGTRAAYLAIRGVAAPLLADRVLEPDIRAVRRILDDGTLLKRVDATLPTPLGSVPALSRGP